MILFSESSPAEKTASVCLFPLCWYSNSKTSFATCPQVGEFLCHSLKNIFSLVMSSPGGPDIVNG